MNANDEKLLREECEKRGLPVSLAALLRHIENNHAAALGACRDSNATLRRRLETYESEAIG